VELKPEKNNLTTHGVFGLKAFLFTNYKDEIRPATDCSLEKISVNISVQT